MANNNKITNILVLGLQQSGKTSLLSALVGGSPQVNEKNGLRIEEIFRNEDNVRYVCIDYSSQLKNYANWEDAFFKNIHGLILIIDSDEENKLTETKSFLKIILNEKKLNYLPILFIFNNRNKKLNVDNLEKQMNIKNIIDRKYKSCQCSLIDNSSQNKGLIKHSEEWLIQEANKSKKKDCCLKCLRISIFLLQCVSLIFSSIITHISRNIDVKTNVSIKISEDLLSNFQTGYFTKFEKNTELLNKKNKSNLLGKTNFIETNIIYRKWQGTIKGCGNKTSKIVKKINEEESCDDDLETLDKIQPIEINSFYGISLKGIDHGKYYDLLFDGSIVSKNETCPEGKKNCGYIDTLYNILCLDNNVDCPISYFLISKTKPDNVKNLKTINGKEGYNLYYSNNPYDNSIEVPFIINSFTISENPQRICSIPGLYYTDLPLFDLDAINNNEYYKSNCMLKDDYSQKHIYEDDQIYIEQVGLIDNYKLYEENGIIDKIEKNNLTYYGYKTDIYKSKNLYLFYRPHYGFKKECLKNKDFNLNILYDIRTQANKMNNYSSETKLVIGSLVASTGDLLFSLNKHLNLLNIINKDWNNALNSFIEDWKNPAIQFITVIFSVATLVINYYGKSYDDNYENDMDCSDDITNDNYNVMIHNLQKAGEKIFAIWILSIILLIVCAISVILGVIEAVLKGKDKRDKKDSNDNLVEGIGQ